MQLLCGYCPCVHSYSMARAKLTLFNFHSLQGKCWHTDRYHGAAESCKALHCFLHIHELIMPCITLQPV